MSILDKTRKKLWAKSGNRCAICKVELFQKEILNSESNIGEECHIISSKIGGPRFKEGMDDYDNYDNLILLCRNHHKEIDDLEATYTEEILNYVKQNHEKWVNKTLNDAVNSEAKKPQFLSRITSGKELMSILINCYAFESNYDDLKSIEEAEYIASVFQLLFEYSENSEFYEISDKVKIGHELNELLKELETKGFFLFGEKVNKVLKFKDGSTDTWPVVAIVIKKKDSDEIITMNLKT